VARAKPAAAKVMERIARRERANGARSGSPNVLFIFFKIFRLFAAIFGLFWRVGNFFEKKSPKKRILTKFIELF
jgi:hypothetical protein